MDSLCCRKCGSTWKIVPRHGEFYVECNCQPPVTLASNGTSEPKWVLYQRKSFSDLKE